MYVSRTSKEQGARQRRDLNTTHRNTEFSHPATQSGLTSPLPLPVQSKGCALFPSTKVSIFFIINKTLSNAHSYKCFTLFAYSIRVINPKDRCQCNCWILQINLAAIKATNLSNGTVSQSQAVNWCEHRFKTDKDIYKNINQFGRQSQRYC